MKKTVVAVYDSHDKALKAVQTLADHKFPMEKVSLVGKAEIIEDHLKVKHLEDAEIVTPVAIGAIAGPIVGLLTGLGIFAIPGLGFLYGAGAIVGALAGFDFGLIAGMLGSALAALGIKRDKVVKYEEHIKAGQFLVIVQGEEEEINRANQILKEHGLYTEIETHE